MGVINNKGGGGNATNPTSLFIFRKTREKIVMEMLNGRNGVGKRMAFVVLALAIFIYVILNTLRPGGLMAYVLPSACWGFLALVALKASFGRIRSWFNAHASIAAASVAICYIIILMNIGLFTSFGRSTMSFTPMGLFINSILVLATLLGMEFSRACLVKSFGRRSPFLAIGLVTLLYSFLSISMFKFVGLNDPLGVAKFLGVGLLPAIAENLLASYLAFVGGPVASLAYRGPIMAFWWFCPILPHLSWGVEALLGVMVPTVGFFAINMYTSPMALRRVGIPVEIKGFGRARKSSLRGWVIVAVLCVVVVWASTGLLGIQPTTVLSGSMRPTMDVGDMAIVREVPADSIQPGDIIQFWREGEMIIHRVVEARGKGDGRLFVTKGDANAEPDSALVTSGQVRGEVVLNIPKIGWAAIAVKGFFSGAWSFLSANPMLTVFAIGSGVFIFYSFRMRRRWSTRRWRGQGWRRGGLTDRKLVAPLSLILVVMAATGFAYSHWSQTIYISGTVTTGTWGARICGYKFYDGNVNGTWDVDEPPIEGFKIELWLNDTKIAENTTGSDGKYCFHDLEAGTYTVKEVLPENWENTTPSSLTITLEAGEVSEGNNFGNICLEQGHGGHTIGFWKNHTDLITLDYVNELNKLNLFRPSGWTFPPFDNMDIANARDQIENYLGATAVDMRWMLSAQLIATKLNVLHGFLDGSTIVHVGPSSYVPSGFISITEIMENANAALLLPENRPVQEFWKDILG
jgi:signal peptidase